MKSHCWLAPMKQLCFTRLLSRFPMLKFYQMEYKSQFNTINIDLISGVEIKKVYKSQIFSMFQDRLLDRTVIFTDGSRTDNDS